MNDRTLTSNESTNWVECFADNCGWAGDRSDAIPNPFDPDDLHCPLCDRRLTEDES